MAVYVLEYTTTCHLHLQVYTQKQYKLRISRVRPNHIYNDERIFYPYLAVSMATHTQQAVFNVFGLDSLLPYFKLQTVQIMKRHKTLPACTSRISKLTSSNLKSHLFAG